MATALRAFLMLRHGSGEWYIEVHHDLEGLIRGWESKGEGVTAAVVHVGFERRVAKSFETLAAAYPERVLVTAAAKGALPHAFKSSSSPVGTVSGEPIFLALEGWGYAETDPQAASSSVASATTLLGWVGSFARENGSEASSLLEQDIVDEESYLKNEAKLDADLRKRLGIFRSDAILGQSSDDPCAMARAAPPWLQDRALESLNLTVRIANVFRDREIITVADLQRLTTADLLRFQNFGRTSIHHLVGILQTALLQGPEDHEVKIERANTGTLLEALKGSLRSCTERERDILIRRMGLECEPETLQEISQSYGVTRERVRQIEDKVIQRLVRQEVWDDLLAIKLKEILAHREFPLPLIGAEAVDPWFSGLGSQRSAARYLFANMCSAGAALVEIDDVQYLSFLSQDEWQEALSSARHMLASGVEARWSKAQCETYVSSLLPDHGREFAGLLWEAASRWCHFADGEEEAILISYGRGAEHLVEVILQESEQPLHYSDIAVRASKRGSRELDERRAHAAAAEVGYLFGPGTYGLLKHVSVTRAEREALADEAAEIVTGGPADRQWHTSELIEELRRRDVPVASAFDKYQLDVALKQHGGLTSLGRMVWAYPMQAENSARLDIRQAVISLLQQAGRPLTERELRQRLIAVRGINNGMQFFASDPVIKLDASTWALNDRDLSVKRADQSAFLDQVVARLTHRGSSVHISECAALLGTEVPARAIFCLASSHPKLQISPGRFLGLRS